MADGVARERRAAVPPARPGDGAAADTNSVIGDTIVGPRSEAEPPAEPPDVSGATFLMSAGAFAGLLSPPEADGELGRLGGYRVLRELGRGGMGLVFEAEDPKLGRRVALKVMLPEFAKQPEAKERFLREARSAAAVEHDHVVPVYQVGEDRGVPFLAMRLLPGESLADLLARKKCLPAASVAGLGRQAALGLAAAHERGLIHRDVKPGNLWVEPGGRVRVLDFGLARLAEAAGELTRTGNVVGTPEYLAPEQLRGEALDGRADLFSLGAVLYRSATGTSPFRKETLYATLRAVESETPPDPRTLRPDLPAPLAELILKLMAKDRTGRPASAAAAAKAFKEIGPALAKPGEAAPAAAPVAAVPAAASAVGPGAPAAAVPLSLASAATAFPVFEPPPVLPSRAVARKPVVKAGGGAKGGGRPPRRNRNVLLAAGGGMFALLGVIFALTLDFGDATLRVEGLDPDMQVTVTGGGKTVVVVDRKTGATAELDPGTYELTLKGGDGEGFAARLMEKTVTLTRGGEKVVVIEKVAKAATRGDGGAAPTSGGAVETVAADSALEFDGERSYVFLPTLAVPEGPVTVEAWIRPTRAEPPELEVVAVGGSGDHRVLASLLRGNPSELRFAYQGEKNLVGSQQPFPAAGGARLVHVAGVRDGGVLRCFVDGKPVERPIGEGDFALAPGWAWRSYIGAEAVYWNPAAAADPTLVMNRFAGVIDEVRYSKVARYSGDFTPPRRFEPDADTLALYHFDEGAGEVAKDASGNGHDGKVVAAKWVAAADGSNPSAPAMPVVAAPSEPPVGPLGWDPGPGEDVLPGLVARPAALPGVKRWNVETVAPRQPVGFLALNPLRPLAATHGFGVVRVHSTDSGRLAAVFSVRHHGADGVWWSPDGRFLAYRDSDRVLLFDADAGTSRGLRPARGEADPVTSVAWSPSGDALAVGLLYGRVELWRTEGTAGPVLSETFPTSSGETNVAELRWSADGSRLAAAYRRPGPEDEIRVYPAAGGGPEATLPADDFNNFSDGRPEAPLAWRPGEPTLAFVDAEGDVRLWSPGAAEAKPLAGRAGGLVDLAWSAAGDRLASADGDGRLRVWASDGTAVGAAEIGSELSQAAWSSDGATLATVDANGSGRLRLWTAEAKPLPDPPGQDGDIRQVAWRPDGRPIVADRVHGLREWTSDGAMRPLGPRAGQSIVAAAWAPAGRYLATGGLDGALRVWAADGRLVSVPYRRDGVWVRSVGWTPDGHVYLGQPVLDGTVLTWRPDGTPERPSGVKTAALRGLDQAQQAAWSPAGDLLAVRSGDTVTLRSLVGGPGRSLPITTTDVLTDHWRPDGSLLAVIPADRESVRLFGRDGTPGPTLAATAAVEGWLRWSPDGRFVGAKTAAGWQLWAADGTSRDVFPDLAAEHKAWSPEGDRLAAAGGGLRVWRFRPDAGDAAFEPAAPAALPRPSAGVIGKIDWSRAGRIASADWHGLLAVHDPDDPDAVWSAMLFGDGSAASFTRAGEVIHGDPATLERELAYMLEYGDGRQEVLTHSAFVERFGKAATAGAAP